MTKKEIQEVIVKKIQQTTSEEEFLNILKIVAPGTKIRKAINGILNGGMGALIVIQNERLFPLMDGGFKINTKFTPQRMIELGKMDGAIILSHNLKRIEYANVLLTPNNSIKSEETGTRHKAGERTTKQVGTLVIAISERKNEITLFYKDKRHILKSTEEIFSYVNRYIRIIERHREIFDKLLIELNKSEIILSFNINLAIQIIQKGKIIEKIAREIKRPIIELGKDGNFLNLHLKELILNIEKETNLIIKDYTAKSFRKSKKMINELNYEELLEKEKILKSLYHEKITNKIHIKGWRLLSKMELSDQEIAKIFKEGTKLKDVLYNKDLNLIKIIDQEKYDFFTKNLKKLMKDNVSLNEPARI